MVHVHIRIAARRSSGPADRKHSCGVFLSSGLVFFRTVILISTQKTLGFLLSRPFSLSCSPARLPSKGTRAVRSNERTLCSVAVHLSSSLFYFFILFFFCCMRCRQHTHFGSFKARARFGLRSNWVLYDFAVVHLPLSCVQTALFQFAVLSDTSKIHGSQ